MTAHELFIRMGLSKRLVDDFIRPTLLVGLFKPPEELSAAVTMELLYYYALAHQDSFDVRWIAKGRGLLTPLCCVRLQPLRCPIQFISSTSAGVTVRLQPLKCKVVD